LIPALQKGLAENGLTRNIAEPPSFLEFLKVCSAPPMRSLCLMSPPKKKRARLSQPATRKPDDNGERMICAVCGRVIDAGGGDTPVIYSVCANCKRASTGRSRNRSSIPNSAVN
jgi:hypothetical protein